MTYQTFPEAESAARKAAYQWRKPVLLVSDLVAGGLRLFIGPHTDLTWSGQLARIATMTPLGELEVPA